MNKVLLGLVLLLTLAAPVNASETLSLQACLQRVREQSPELLEVASSPRLAASAVDSISSAYRPRVGISAGYTLQQAPQQVVIGGISAPTQDQDFAHLNIVVDQLLYDFGRTAGGLGAARAAARAAQFIYASVEQKLLLQTVASYYRVLSAQALLRTAQDEVVQTEAHLKRVNALYEQGVVTRNDVLQAEVRLAANHQQVLALNGEEQNSWLELNYLTARPAAARGELEAEALASPESASDLIPTRPDLLAQQERIQGAVETVRKSASEFRPELYAHLAADYVANNHVEEQTIYSTTLGLRFLLYDGGARQAKLNQAEEVLRQERQHLINLEQHAQLEEQTARNEAHVAQQQINVALAAIGQARENLRINQERYQEQVGTATEVLDAQTLLTQARTALVKTQFAYQVAVARVRYATGQL